MIIEKFTITPFQQNTRVVACKDTRKAICIDPGEECPELVEFVNESGFDLQAITLTHAHLDHVGGTLALSDSFPDAEIILHKDDEEMYLNLPLQPLMMGIPQAQLKPLKMDYGDPPKITRYWEDGEEYAVGNLVFRILHTPGHTKGHVIFAEEKEKKVFVGDCLFQGSIGRTDLPGGSYEQIMDSLNEKIVTLGDDFTVYSGHGPETSIGKEKRTNPFLTGVYQPSKGRFV
ncbi:MAG: MBL fold metallo-hydrolase [Acidobacteria bacterium]|nr:MAG: MBL fold metallo-hydrolase [Acidobacteriota bacterium]REJ97986.1 MAG: MBL fold metallo-hydrolase [Acidobacteriota bacterium]REK16729.1 MAG: MBL fold metallo-hydrolase [Acidobacteriota bacterium]REK42640.1 MAG: MBL fold metallo-hydrolase [Acidobacteriota bacterium]